MSKKVKEHRKLVRVLGRLCVFSLACALLMVLGLTVVCIYVKAVTGSYILTDAAEIPEDIDCIIILGASVRNGDTPSLMLQDRLDKGIELYKEGCAPKILMSGDHGSEYYNEVGVMKQYAIEHGVPSEDIFLDHAGFSTYESMYRAAKVFGAKRVLIVTQSYHLTRAVYDARKLGLDAYGVAAASVDYSGQEIRSIREYLAIGKDFVMTLLKPEPTLLGDPISLEGSGDVTDD